MIIEFRRITALLNSHKVEKAINLPYEVVYTLKFTPGVTQPVPFIVNGKDLLAALGVVPEGYFKAYFVGIEKVDDKEHWNILENFSNVLTINKKTNIVLKEVQPLITS